MTEHSCKDCEWCVKHENLKGENDWHCWHPTHMGTPQGISLGEFKHPRWCPLAGKRRAHTHEGAR